MKKNLGICRNRLPQLAHSKKELHRKKNRFQPLSHKHDEILSDCTSPPIQNPPGPPKNS